MINQKHYKFLFLRQGDARGQLKMLRTGILIKNITYW